VGCRFGRSSISIARAHPRVRVVAFDLDGTSIERARRNATKAGVSDRIDFHVRVMRSGTPGEYGRQAGFREVEILPVEHDFWRFYRLLL